MGESKPLPDVAPAEQRTDSGAGSNAPPRPPGKAPADQLERLEESEQDIDTDGTDSNRGQ